MNLNISGNVEGMERTILSAWVQPLTMDDLNDFQLLSSLLRDRL